MTTKSFIKTTVAVGVVWAAAMLGAGDAPKPGAEVKQNVKGVEFTMCYCPAGTFTMGSPESEVGLWENETQHTVTLSAFYIGKYEVTFAEYDKYCEATGKEKPKHEGWGRGNRPVINVSWEEAADYCNWLSEQAGLTKCYDAAGKCDLKANGYRLPTEAEWEYACRAASKGAYCFGDDINQLCKYGNYCDKTNTNGLDWQDKKSSDGYDKTAPIGQYLANAWGIHDMHGNVWELCSDLYADYTNVTDVVKDPICQKGVDRVVRGGSWTDYGRNCRSAARRNYYPEYGSNYLGFRLVRPSVQ